MKHRLLLTLLIVLSAITLFDGTPAPLYAQQTYTEQEVIDMVAGLPPFSYGLDTISDWSAAAFDANNAYGVWHVQFWNGDGEEIGWANVIPAHGRLYDHEAPFDATEGQLRAAEPLVRAFLYDHPDLVMLLGDPEAFQEAMYVGYNGWIQAWGVWVERGEDSLYLLVQFEGKEPDALTSPELIRIEFANVPSYEEWQEGMSSEATTIAFTAPAVAAALRDVTGWISQAEQQDDGLWQVTFQRGEDTLGLARVDLETRELVSWETP